jgi:hypothetical protein
MVRHAAPTDWTDDSGRRFCAEEGSAPVKHEPAHETG